MELKRRLRRGAVVEVPAGLLEAPHYTRPPEFRGLGVPEILLSGHHEKIRAWRAAESRARTARFRPDLLARLFPGDES